MTKGEYRVGYDFNPSGSMDVTSIKRLAADLIDLIEGLPADPASDAPRCKALAQTYVETAAMYAIKAATKKPQGGDLALARSMDDPNPPDDQALVEEPKEE